MNSETFDPSKFSVDFCGPAHGSEGFPGAAPIDVANAGYSGGDNLNKVLRFLGRTQPTKDAVLVVPQALEEQASLLAFTLGIASRVETSLQDPSTYYVELGETLARVRPS